MSLGYADSSTYRWVDESGNVHYADRIPPAQIDQGHIKLSEEGLRTEMIAPAPTEEEIRQAVELERLQKEEARRVEQDKVANQQLIQNFRTIEDLALAREGKVAAIEALGQTTRDRIRFELRRLRELHQKSAELERTAKTVPAQFQEDIASAEQLLRDGYSTILEHEFLKESIRQDFDGILARYRRLRQLPESADTSRKRAAGLRLNNLVSCHGSEQCAHAWERALAYVRDQAATKEEITGPGLLIAAQRDEREDRLLTLVWIQKTPQEPVYLYLDLECKNRLTANLTCTNPSALAIRDGFRAAVDPQAD
ncbi:DUF4124 domain-containing protein [Thiocystis violascens]|nr:DUF4124 domain-containing protein [Thiocystis violascens]